MSEGTPGYYSLLRWRKDPKRDEARNIAVIVVDVRGETGKLRHAPVGSISPRLHEQGIIDAFLVGLEDRMPEFSVASLRQLKRDLHGSLTLTEPSDVVFPDGDQSRAVEALYKAYLAPHAGGSNHFSKSRVLDRVVDTFRKHRQKVRRGAYIKDYIFDVVVETPAKSVLEVLSFATPAKNWVSTEHEAGYFLHAIEHLNKRGIAVVQPPRRESGSTARESHERVIRLFRSEKVRVIDPGEVAKTFELDPQLQLSR